MRTAHEARCVESARPEVAHLKQDEVREVAGQLLAGLEGEVARGLRLQVARVGVVLPLEAACRHSASGREKSAASGGLIWLAYASAASIHSCCSKSGPEHGCRSRDQRAKARPSARCFACARWWACAVPDPPSCRTSRSRRRWARTSSSRLPHTSSPRPSRESGRRKTLQT